MEHERRPHSVEELRRLMGWSEVRAMLRVIAIYRQVKRRDVEFATAEELNEWGRYLRKDKRFIQALERSHYIRKIATGFPDLYDVTEFTH